MDRNLTPESTIPFWRQLRWNLIMCFAALAIIPVVIVVTVTLSQTREQARAQVSRQLESVAELKISQINRWLADSQLTLNLLLATPVRDSLLAFLTGSVSDPEVAQVQLNQLLQRVIISSDTHPEDGLHFQELFVYNNKGQIVAASEPGRVGQLVTNRPYFVPSLAEEQLIQSPFYEVGRKESTLIITRALRNERSNEVLGVLAGRLDLSTLGAIMTERSGLGETGETYLVSPENSYLITPSRFESEGYPRSRAYHSEGIERALQGKHGWDTYPNYRNPAIRVIGLYHWLPELKIGMIAEIAEAEALAPFAQIRNFNMGIAILASITAVLLGLYNATRISRPIVILTQAARQVANGQLEVVLPTPESIPDELGILANTFRIMADQLNELVIGLEQRVAERTHALKTSAAVSRSLSTLLDQKQLVAAVVEQIRSAFNYYYVHIYLLDQKGENLVMAGGTGEAGRVMLSRGHTISSGKGLVGRAAQTHQIVLVPDVSQEPDWLPNSLLPETRAEVAVPIMLGDRVLGVLEVQHNLVGGVQQSEAELIQSIANQVAVALQNARLYEQTRRQAEQEALINTIGQKLQRVTSIEEVLQTATREVGQALEASRASIQLSNSLRPTYQRVEADFRRPDDTQKG